MREMFRFDHVQLAMPAGREEEARRFYVDVLGFEEIRKPPELAARGGAWFASGSVALHLGVDPQFVPARKAHPAMCCREYDALIERLTRHGVSVSADPLPFQGRQHCYIDDPFGNRIELVADVKPG